MGRLSVLSGGAGVFLRVVGLRVAAVGGTLDDRVNLKQEPCLVVLLGLFLVVGLRFAAVAGTPVPWKGWEVGGAGWFLVVGL